MEYSANTHARTIHTDACAHTHVRARIYMHALHSLNFVCRYSLTVRVPKLTREKYTTTIVILATHNVNGMVSVSHSLCLLQSLLVEPTCMEHLLPILTVVQR